MCVLDLLVFLLKSLGHLLGNLCLVLGLLLDLPGFILCCLSIFLGLDLLVLDLLLVMMGLIGDGRGGFLLRFSIFNDRV